MRRTVTRQLSFTLLLGLWLSGVVSLASACTPAACRDDCEMHWAVRVQGSCRECGTHDDIATLTLRCTCGASVGHADLVPAVSTATGRSEHPETQAPHLAVLPDVRPHAPFFARFLPRERISRISRVLARASLGLRAPPPA